MAHLPVSPSVLSALRAYDDTDVGARYLVAKHYRMEAEGRRQLLRARLEAIVRQQERAIQQTAVNHQRKKDILRERELSHEESQLRREHALAALPSNPTFRSYVQRSRLESRESVRSTRSQTLQKRKKTAEELRAQKVQHEIAILERKLEDTKLAQQARDRALETHERSDRAQTLAVLNRREQSRNFVEEMKAIKLREKAAEQRDMVSYHAKLVREEEALIKRLTRTQNAVFEAESDLADVEASRVSYRQSTVSSC